MLRNGKQNREELGEENTELNLRYTDFEVLEGQADELVRE